MIPSTFSETKGIHAAIIMDGNGRWANNRGLPRVAGHRAGAAAVRGVVEAAPGLGIRHLTLFAFSSDNWKRPRAEVRGLLALLEHYVRAELERCVDEGVELRMVGRRDRLPWSVRSAIEQAEQETRRGRNLTLRFAVDYSSRDALAQAAALSGPDGQTRESIAYSLAAVYGDPGRRLPDVDLLIRTAGEQRLSDFLLWESAYAELYFTPTLWPDFNRESLRCAMEDYHRRNRTYGALSSSVLPEPESLPIRRRA